MPGLLEMFVPLVCCGKSGLYKIKIHNMLNSVDNQITISIQI